MNWTISVRARNIHRVDRRPVVDKEARWRIRHATTRHGEIALTTYGLTVVDLDLTSPHTMLVLSFTVAALNIQWQTDRHSRATFSDLFPQKIHFHKHVYFSC